MILLINNKNDSVRTILSILAKKGVQGIASNSKKHAIEMLERKRCSMVFIEDDADNRLETDAILKHISRYYPEMPVVMIDSETDSVKNAAENAVRAIRLGCADYLLKPLDDKRIEQLIAAPQQNTAEGKFEYVRFANNGQKQYPKIVGSSQTLTRTLQIAKKAAATSIPILISGASGTGKEAIAHFIHHHSKRASGPYIRVNCASLSETLLESELFGHEKGAFTGAVSLRKGRFETAHGGTLLLDEITETPLSFQAKLLRVLEEQDFERVGGNENIKVNVRIVSTTNRNLLDEVRRGRFREDLYYRLSGLRIIVPSLNRRKEDLSGLVWHFVGMYEKQTNRKIEKLDPKMMDMFAKYDWPGNIRQLRNVVLTSLVLGEGQRLCLADVSWLFDEIGPVSIQQLRQEQTCNQAGFENREKTNEEASLAGMPLVEVEKQAILETLDHADGNQAKAAKILGISDRTLRDKIKKYRQQKQLQAI